MTREQTKVILMTLSEAYRGKFKDVNTQTVDLWHKLLSDLSFREVQAYVVDWIIREKFPPTIADIRSVKTDLLMEATSSKDAYEAWGEVQKSVRKYGHYNQKLGFAMLSPDTKEIVRRMGGYRTFCLMEEKDERVLCAQFRDAYNGMQARKRRNLQTPEGLQRELKRIAESELDSLPEGSIGNFEQRNYTEEEINGLIKSPELAEVGDVG